MKFVIHPAVEPDRLAALRETVPTGEFVNAATPEAAAEAMPGADAFLGKIRPRMLARADRLRWIQAFTVSLEHYMFPALAAHPCLLSNMRGLFSDVIADQVMGYVLCFARNLHVYIRRQFEHRYDPVGGEAARVNNADGPSTINAMDRATIFLPAATMGVIGLGAIGQEIAARASAFGMRILAVDRQPARSGALPSGAPAWPLHRLPEMLAASDFVVIAAPHTPETERLFDRELLRQMKPGSYLINIGRGVIVVLDDLVDALREGWIAGAALDVFEVEPLPDSHLLWDLPGVIITPHTAGYSPVIAERHLRVLLENARRFARGETPVNLVDKNLWF